MRGPKKPSERHKPAPEIDPENRIRESTAGDPSNQAGQTRSRHDRRPSPLAPCKTEGDVEHIAGAPQREQNEHPESAVADRDVPAPELLSPDCEKGSEQTERGESQTGANRSADCSGLNEFLRILSGESFGHGRYLHSLQAYALNLGARSRDAPRMMHPRAQAGQIQLAAKATGQHGARGNHARSETYLGSELKVR